MKKIIVSLSVIAAFLLAVLMVLILTEGQQPVTVTPTGGVQAPSQGGVVIQATTTEPVPTTTAEPTLPPFEPGKTSLSDPANWNFTWEILVDKEQVDSYTREEPIFFESGDYFALPGVASFRGGNYRTDASYGTADITQKTISQVYKGEVGYLSDPEWIGCGWTGQPLVVQWDAETRAIMNLYDEKKEKDGLVELIYAKMDGRIHFYDMEDGSQTRKPVKLGMVFKGSGALDPRGYPLMYVGAGLAQGSKLQRLFVVSLIDGSILYEYCGRDNTAYRKWSAFDSSPLVDAETDTLIWPCENGQLYTFKLNTVYDKEAGTISVTPDAPVKTRYKDDYFEQDRYLGYEGSVTAVENYLYIGDNAGMFQCIDINTMELVWAQDIVDDVNATAAFEWTDDGRGYLYVGPSKDYSNDGKKKGDLPICKIDAQTGEIIWQHIVNCGTYDGCAGGTMGSPLLGRKGTTLEGIVIFAMARTPGAWDSVIYALDTETGEVIWEYETKDYTWSSPVGIYGKDGTGYLFQVDNEGRCYLMDGATGQVLNTFELNAHIEASPVVFGNLVAIGTRHSFYILKVE